MKANNYPTEEISMMDDCLKFEGWRVDEYLLSGWKYRPRKSMCIEYMTSEEKILISTSAAAKEIAAFYPVEVSNRFGFFAEKISKRKGRAPQVPSQGRPRVQVPTQGRPRNQVPAQVWPLQPRPGQPQVTRPVVRPKEWTADQTIPVGWRISNANGNQVLLSPNGLQFGSRREAFQELVTKNYPDEMKAEMFDKLAFEGFQANELLPFGWIYQKTEQAINFLNREGKLLNSFGHALQFFRSSRQFSPEEMKRFQMFQNMIVSNDVQQPVWNEADQTVPYGWKTKPVGNGGNLKMFLSPQGYELKSRRMALKHMVQAGYSQEAVEEMRRFLYYEGWMDDQSLPYLWKMKKNGHNLLFVSREGDLLESSRSAVDYITKNPYAYSNEDIQRIDYVSSMLQKPQVNRVQVQAKRGRPAQVPSIITVKKVDTSYVEDGSVPKGWKVRTDGLRPSYMAPNGTTYKSRRTAYHAMVQERYPNEDIEAMRKTLKYDGWIDNSELPDGWKMKQTKKNTFLMDRGGELFKSFIEAAKFIETYAQYFTQEDVDKVNRLARVNQPSNSGPRVGLSDSGWVEGDPTVPRGWKTKNGNGKGRRLMSPDGLVFKSRRSALELLVRSGAPEELLDQMRTSLSHEGWVKMEIPQGWMCRARSSYGYHFLSSEGLIFRSKGQAFEHLAKSGLLTEENRMNIEMLKGVGKDNNPSQRSYVKRERPPQRIAPDVTWILGDPTVPDGWRVKEAVQHGKTFKMLLSPQGLSFRNRRQAVSYMVKNNFSPEETDEIRSTLVHDGWKEDALLPSTWRFKAKRPFLYCSDQGKVILSHVNAIRKMRSSENYSTEMLNDLKRFIDNHGGTRKEYAARTPGTESLSKIFENAANKDELMRTLDGLGWKENTYLPADWLCKDRKEGNQHIDVLSIEGKRFISYKQAVAFMRTSEKYSEKDIQEFYLFPDGKTRSSRVNESRGNDSVNDGVTHDWVENDSSVPKGWKSKLWVGSASKKCLLSPDGKVFKSRIGAYKYLLKCGSQEQIEEIKTMLGYDGYQSYDLLPAGWMYKKKEYNNLYLTETGEKLNGNNEALKKVKANINLSEEDLHKFFAEQKSDNFNSSLKSYHEPSKTGNLKWLVESGASEEEINKARMELMEVGWSGNQYLPENWLHKQKVGAHSLNLVSAEGLKLITFKAAISFMRTSDKYTEHHIEQLRLFPDGKPSSKMVSKVGPHSQSNISPDDPSWKEDDDTVPKGWKSRKVEGRDVTMLLTPAGVVYWSRRAALKDILRTGGSAIEIEEIRKSLEHDGWKTFDNLPEGWMYKRKETRSVYLTETGELVDGHTKAQKLIANDDKYSVDDQTKIRNFVLEICQEEKPSLEKSPKPIKSKPSLFESLQEKLKSGTSIEKERAVEELEAKGWKENEYLPEGWRFKEYKSTQQINVLSSDGELYHSYRAVLQKLATEDKYSKEDADRFRKFPDGKPHKVEAKKHTEEKVKSKYFTIKQYQEALKKGNEEEISEIKEYYLEKGWIEDDAILPPKWLFKQRPGMTSLTFITSAGELLMSTKEANKYLESHFSSLSIDAKMCKARLGTNYELELKRIDKKVKTEADLKIPSGIKIEKVTTDIKKEPTEEKILPDVSNFKFYSLEEFDTKSNVHLAEFKGVFEKLESLKSDINKKVKIEPSQKDLDFDAL